jgi:hypothetical protein
MPKDQTPLAGNGSQEFGLLGFGDLNTPLTITGPSAEFPVGFFGPRDGEQIKQEVVACLGQAPSALAAFLSVGPGTGPGTVKVFVWTSTFGAAAGSTVTKIHLIAARGSLVTK